MDSALFHSKDHTWLQFTMKAWPLICAVVQANGGIERAVLDAYCWMYSSWNIPQEYKGACTGGDQVRQCHVASLGPSKNWNIPFHSIPFIFILNFWSKDCHILQKKILWHILFQDILQRTYPQLTIFDKSFVFVVNIEKGNLPNLKLRFWVLPSWKRHFASPARNETEL